MKRSRHDIAYFPERCEPRVAPALIFVLNGDGFNATRPNALTAGAARVLSAAGNRVVQLATPRVNTPAAFDAVAARIASMAHGRPVALVGFSAGGALALRLSAVPSLQVVDVLNEYGIPDVRDALSAHNLRPIRGAAPFAAATVDLLSGPVATSAHVVAAYGLNDPGVPAISGAASLRRDLPGADIYTYSGGHGVSITASRPALEDFLAHLG